MTHWVAVTVMVPIRTPEPSPVKAEHDAWKRIEAKVGPDAHVTASRWSRQEPS